MTETLSLTTQNEGGSFLLLFSPDFFPSREFSVGTFNLEVN